LLLDGFSFGFRIPYSGSRAPRFARNHLSALERKDIVTSKLQKEVALGRVAGPFKAPPFGGNIIVSPIGLTPKKNSNEFRLIFDLSYPRNRSINDGIDPSLCSVEYAHFDAAIQMVQKMGAGCSLFKVDIQSAFRLLPIHPEDFQLLGMFHDGQFYVDKALPFGCSLSCALFEKFSSFLEWHLRRTTNSDNWLHYLDDFLAGDPDKKVAQDMLRANLKSFQEIGVPVAEEKIEGPTTVLTFLGIEIDTISMTVCLPEQKLRDLLKTVEAFIEKDQKKSDPARVAVPDR
jgi:hypothetical protein